MTKNEQNLIRAISLFVFDTRDTGLLPFSLTHHKTFANSFLTSHYAGSIRPALVFINPPANKMGLMNSIRRTLTGKSNARCVLSLIETTIANRKGVT